MTIKLLGCSFVIRYIYCNKNTVSVLQCNILFFYISKQACHRTRYKSSDHRDGRVLQTPQCTLYESRTGKKIGSPSPELLPL